MVVVMSYIILIFLGLVLYVGFALFDVIDANILHDYVIV